MRTNTNELPVVAEDRIDLGAATAETMGVGQPLEPDGEQSFYKPIGVTND